MGTQSCSGQRGGSVFPAASFMSRTLFLPVRLNVEKPPVAVHPSVFGVDIRVAVLKTSIP